MYNVLIGTISTPRIIEETASWCPD